LSLAPEHGQDNLNSLAMMTSTRRGFIAAQAALSCLHSQTARPTQRIRWPREIAGIPIADSAFTKVAIEALQDSSPPFLVNHAVRTFFFGAMIGRQKKLPFDGEILFLASALHDLGLTSTHAGKLPFELQGAEAARRILSEAGLPPAKTQMVWDGIAMHCQAMANFKPPEIMLVAAGAAADVVGGGIDSLPRQDVDAVLSAFPRLEFKHQFVQNCAEIAARYPGGAGRTFMRDIAERKIPGYKPSNICDAIDAAPFAE
jgi:hypothetical protein